MRSALLTATGVVVLTALSAWAAWVTADSFTQILLYAWEMPPYHQPVTPPVVVPHCDGGDGLYYLCSDPWVPRKFAI